MSRPTPDEVREFSTPMANELHAKYFELLQSKGPAFAAVAVFDACSIVLGVALLPFNHAARLSALDLLRSEIEEQATDFRAQFNSYAEREAAN